MKARISTLLYNLATDKEKGIFFLPIKGLLYLISLSYAAAVTVLAFFKGRRRRSLNCKAISVGNITLGGTGKTSLVEYIARCLNEQGRKVAILSRGYKRQGTGDRGQGTGYRATGDEPAMLRQKLPAVAVIVDPDRIRGAKRALEQYAADTVILDDGFQQWHLRKDLEIVTIDAINPFGNGHLLPRGILRQPLCALKNADVFVLTKTDLAESGERLKDLLKGINPQALICDSVHQPAGFYELNRPQEPIGLEGLKGKRVSLFSGIADPDSFERLIAKMGISAGLSFRFADHHHYARQDLKRIAADSARNNIQLLVTTEKDAARLCGQGADVLWAGIKERGFKILVLRIKLVFKDDDKERFLHRLLTLYPL